MNWKKIAAMPLSYKEIPLFRTRNFNEIIRDIFLFGTFIGGIIAIALITVGQPALEISVLAITASNWVALCVHLAIMWLYKPFYSLLKRIHPSELLPLIFISLIAGFISLLVPMTAARAVKLIFFTKIQILTFSSMAALICLMTICIGHVYDKMREQLVKEVTEAERLKRELEIAKEIQLSMLPKKDPDIPLVEITSYYAPAEIVGGDYYDFFTLPNHHLGIVIGDVTGHGIQAGLLVGMTKSCLHHQIKLGYSVPEVMQAMNEMFCDNLQKTLLMTFCYAIIDLKGHAISFSSAGHPCPYCYRYGSNTLVTPKIAAFPLGVRKETTYQVQRIDLARNDILVFYSDGIIEALNQKGEFFGFERFENLIQTSASLPVGEIRSTILEALKAHCQKVDQTDDITFVIVKL